MGIRKLLEKKEIKSNYPILNFYCNWCLHSQIEKIAPQIKELLENIGETVNSSVYDFTTPEKMLNFELLQKDLQKFLDDFSISYNLKSNWSTIRKLLIDIISNCPLKIKTGRIREFNFIPSKNYKTAECIIKFRNRRPDRITISVHFLDHLKWFHAFD